MYLFNNHWNELERMQREMDALFNRFGGRRYRFPPVNLYDNDAAVVAEWIIPGVAKEDITISFENGTLTVKGERKSAADQSMTVVREERNSGAFSRAVEIPVTIDASKISAALNNGILTITMPKTEEAKPKQITIS